MPRQILEFRVVVASPSDVFETRKIVFEVLYDLNRIFEVQGIAVRGLGWEEYAVPGISTDAQSVITEQVLREYDILIAIFATKLGTPTPSALSGTVEEIEHAIANSESPMGNHRVQVYFRDRLDSISDVSLDELKRVFDYRELLRTRGVLYRSFKGDADLAKEVRINVQRPIFDFLQKARLQVKVNDTAESDQPNRKGDIVTASTNAINDSKSDEELGLLDHIEISQDAIATTTSSLNRISELIEEIGLETNALTAEIEKNSSPNIPISARKKTINDFAQFLKSRAREITELANTARQNYDVYASALITAAALEREHSDPEQYKKNLGSFLAEAEVLLSKIPQNRTSILGFKTALENIPRITIQFNQAKRELIEALNGCLELFDQTERRIFEITAET